MTDQEDPVQINKDGNKVVTVRASVLKTNQFTRKLKNKPRANTTTAATRIKPRNNNNNTRNNALTTTQQQQRANTTTIIETQPTITPSHSLPVIKATTTMIKATSDTADAMIDSTTSTNTINKTNTLDSIINSSNDALTNANDMNNIQNLHNIHPPGAGMSSDSFTGSQSTRNVVQGKESRLRHVDAYTIEGDSLIKFGLFFIVATFVSITWLFDSKDIRVNEVLSVIMGGVFLQWIVTVVVTVSQSTQLSALRIINTKLDGFGTHVTFPTQLIKLSDKPIESISEFSGVRGGTLHISMLVMSVTNSLLLVISLQLRKFEIGEVTGKREFWQLSERQIAIFILGIITALGFLFVGYFEMNHHSQTHSFMHYVGTVFIAVGNVPFGLIFRGSALFWVVGGVGGMLFFGYAACVALYGLGRKYPENEDQVHRVSLWHLWLEIGWVTMAALATCLMVGNLDKV